MKTIGTLLVDTQDEVVDFTLRLLEAGIRFSCGRDGARWLFEFYVNEPAKNKY